MPAIRRVSRFTPRQREVKGRQKKQLQAEISLACLQALTARVRERCRKWYNRGVR